MCQRNLEKRQGMLCREWQSGSDRSILHCDHHLLKPRRWVCLGFFHFKGSVHSQHSATVHPAWKTAYSDKQRPPHTSRDSTRTRTVLFIGAGKRTFCVSLKCWLNNSRFSASCRINMC